MLRFFYPQDPADKVRFDSLENAWRQRLLKDGYSEASITAGSQYASMICQSVIEWSKTDGDDKMNDAYDVPKGMGMWEPTPPRFLPPITPYMGNCRCLVKGSIDNTLPPPPAAFSTERQSGFYKMAEEVYNVSQQMDEEKKAYRSFLG